MELPCQDMRTRLRGSLFAGLLAHLPHLLLLAALFAAAVILLDGGDERLSLEIGLLVEVWVILLPFFIVLAGLVGFLRLRPLRQPGHRLPKIGRWLARRPWGEILLLRVPLALALTAATSYLYFTFKVNIATFTDFTWDHVFAAADRALFLGYDPWRLTHALLPWAWATKVIDAIYLAWYLVLVAAILAVGALPLRNPLRLAFLLAIALDWVIGGVLIATLLPAAGPVYLERITGDPTFRPLMEHLHSQSTEVRLVALAIQEWLWKGYATKAVDPAGISAFPSLHVAIPATCACLGMAVDRVVGMLLTVFTALVLVGSVHLGWHYAVDGFGGVALGVGCWWMSRRVVAWWLERTERYARLARAEPSYPAE